MTNVNFSQDFENVINGLRVIENHIENELKPRPEMGGVRAVRLRC